MANRNHDRGNQRTLSLSFKIGEIMKLSVIVALVGLSIPRLAFSQQETTNAQIESLRKEVSELRKEIAGKGSKLLTLSERKSPTGHLTRIATGLTSEVCLDRLIQLRAMQKDRAKNEAASDFTCSDE